MDAIRQYKKLLCVEGNADTSEIICEILNNSFSKEVIEVIVADIWGNLLQPLDGGHIKKNKIASQ